MMISFSSIVVVLASLTLHFVGAQECPLPVRGDLEGNGGLIATALGVDSTTLLSEASVVCLASDPTRDQFRFASVLVSFTREGSTNAEFGQLDLECTGSQWSSTNLDLSPTAADVSTTSLRRDCAACVAMSNDPEYDAESHCLPCFGCTSTGLGQCTSPTPSSADCCNFYDASDMCTLACPVGTGASADTNFTCTDPCSPNPCVNGGSCSPTSVSGSVVPSCFCVGSWEGERCEACGIADCRTCSQTVDVCSECEEGFEMLSSGACSCPLVCVNGGMLVDSQCSCSCPAGYSGPTCAVVVGGQSCLVEDCQNCSASSPMVCEQCEDGFQLDDEQLACSEKNFIGPLSLGAFVGVVVGSAVAALALLIVVTLVCCCCCCSRNSDSVYV